LSLKANVIANYFGQGCRAIMGIAFVPLYIKYLGIESYGLIGFFAILQGSLGLLDLGMKPALGREMARFTAGALDAQSIRNLLRSVEVVSLIIALAIAVCIFGASRWLASDWLTATALPIATIAHALTAMGALCALRFIENIYVSSIVGLQRQVLESIISSSMATLRSLGAVAVLAWVSPTIEAFFIWQCIVSLITVPIFSYFVYRSLPSVPHGGRFSWVAVVGIWRFAAGVMAITLLALLLTQIDKILLSRLLPLKVFGFYALAGALANSLYMLASPISGAFYPQFTALATQGNSNALQRAYHQAAQLSSVVTGAAAVVLIVFADTVLSAWTGNPILTQQVAPLVQVLAFGTLLNTLMGIPYQMQLAHGWTELTIRINIVAVVLLVPAIFLVVPTYGALGAAWIWVALNIGYLVVAVYLMHRRLLPLEKWRWYGQDVLAPLLAAASIALLCRGAVPNPTSRIGEVGLLMLASVCVFLSAALVSPLVRVQLQRHLLAAIKFGYQRL
jgi:O-antigen/teichoic acid export membrane protein